MSPAHLSHITFVTLRADRIHTSVTAVEYNLSRNILGEFVDSEARREKQQKLLLELVERKIRLRAEELYQGRDLHGGSELGDWLKAESEVLANSIVAPLYRRSRGNPGTSEPDSSPSASE